MAIDEYDTSMQRQIMRMKDELEIFRHDLTAAYAKIERLETAFGLAHGGLLCIGSTNSNWAEYARNVAADAAKSLNQ